MRVAYLHRNEDESTEHDEEFAHLEVRIADARERHEAATKQYNRLCSICIAAQQVCTTGHNIACIVLLRMLAQLHLALTCASMHVPTGLYPQQLTSSVLS